jgi:hypothetical protein
MLQEEIQSLCNFSFLKIVNIEPVNKVQSFFLERDPFSAHKTSLFISFTSLIGMEWTKAFLVCMDLSTMAQFSLIFYKNIWRIFLCCPHCPQMKRIPMITITTTIKVQILCSLASQKALLIPYLPQNSLEIISYLLITGTCPKQQMLFLSTKEF